jgi:hypothetical protein
MTTTTFQLIISAGIFLISAGSFAIVFFRFATETRIKIAALEADICNMKKTLVDNREDTKETRIENRDDHQKLFDLINIINSKIK